ncbi:MAG: pilus assembly protein [Pirellulales bacterium]|nr:pilus assembly protein [Pirellulales bacterium]
MTNRKSQRILRTGAAAVEFAIVAPIFFIFVLGSLEFGRLNVIRHTADQAAYEAARHAMVPGATAAEARTKANRMLRFVGARGARVDVQPAVLGPDVDEITVTVDVPMNQNGWVTPRFTRNSTIHAVSRLKTERAQE